MRDQDKALDDFFRRKLADREIGYEESHWEAAQELIAADERQRRRKLIIWVFLAFMLCTSLGVGLWAWNRGATPPQHEKVTQSPPPTPLATPPSLSKELPPSHSMDSAVLLPRSSGPAFAQSKAASPSIPTIDSETKSEKSTYKPENLSPSSTQERTAPFPDSTQLEGSFTPATHLNALTQFEKSGNQSPISQGYSSQLDSIHRSIHFPTPLLPPLSSSDKPLAQSLQCPTSPPVRSLSVIVGTNVSRGLENGQMARAMYTSHPVLGVGYRHGLNHHFSLQGRLLYEGRGGLNADTSLTSRRYSFGLEEEQTLVSPKRLHYLSAPITLQYHPIGSHTLTVGLNPAWMFNSSSSIQTVTRNSFGEEQVRQESSWGYNEGFQAFDLGITMGYTYYLGKGFNLGSEVHWGLRDLTRPNYFNNPAIDRNIQIRFILSYDLLKF